MKQRALAKVFFSCRRVLYEITRYECEKIIAPQMKTLRSQFIGEREREKQIHLA